MTKDKQKIEAVKSLLWLVIAALSEEPYQQLYSCEHGLAESVEQILDAIFNSKE